MAAINLIQSLAEGRVVAEGDQTSHVKGKMNPIASGKHEPTKDSETKEVLTGNDQDTNQSDCKKIYDNQEECKIVHVEEGNESIKEM